MTDPKDLRRAFDAVREAIQQVESYEPDVLVPGTGPVVVEHWRIVEAVDMAEMAVTGSVSRVVRRKS
jgi:hypothetical protein